MTTPPPPRATVPGSEPRPGWALAEAGGRIVAADARFAERTGAGTAAAVIGRGWPALLAPAEAPRADEALRALSAGRSWRGTVLLDTVLHDTVRRSTSRPSAGAPPAAVDLALYPAAAPEGGPPEGGMVILHATEPALLPTAPGVDALELLTEYSADLLVVDAAMIEPADGRLLRALDELRPELRSHALLLAGPEHEQHATALAVRGAGLVLAKPFDVDALLEAVADVLEVEPV